MTTLRWKHLEAESRKLLPAVYTSMGIEEGSFSSEWLIIRIITLTKVLAKLLTQMPEQMSDDCLECIETALRNVSALRKERADGIS